jgi:hypothetical protein
VHLVKSCHIGFDTRSGSTETDKSTAYGCLWVTDERKIASGGQGQSMLSEWFKSGFDERNADERNVKAREDLTREIT